MEVRSECGFCENNGPRSRGIAFFRGGVLPESWILIAYQKFDIFIFAFGDVEKVPYNRICKSLVLYSLLTIVLIEEVTRQNYMMADYVEKQNLY